MYWKLLHLLTVAHCVLSFNINSRHVGKDHPLWNLVEKTYDTRPKKFSDTDGDVGEPLILTPFIENNKTDEARTAARVDDKYLLPGIESYAGYLTVNKKYNGNLFFWYFPVATKSVTESPLILWLQGGPGASSLYGLFLEIGPFSATDNQTLKENKFSWGKHNSLLFIDNPVGAGFSFSDDGGYTTNQTTIGENLYTALQQFLTMFPELRPAPLFIAGESYAGKHIPSIGFQILRHKNQDIPINLQGLAIGNGYIDPPTLQRYSYFAREVGLVDDKMADVLKELEAEITDTIKDGETIQAFMIYGGLLNTFEYAANLTDIYNYLSNHVELFASYTDFVQTSRLRRTLHVGNTMFSRPGRVYSNLVPDIMNSAKPWLEELLDHYRVLVYSGHLDCIVPYHASVNTYNSLKYSAALEYKNAKRLSWYHKNTLAGYYKVGGKLTEVMVRGAGHMVPIDKPSQTLGLITAFIRDIPLNQDTGNLVN